MEKKEDKKLHGSCSIPTFKRNNYFDGKLMSAQNFSNEQEYFNAKRWLINRMVNGCGVVCGLDVSLKEGTTDTVIVTPGLAIDGWGREIVVPEVQEVTLSPEDDTCPEDSGEPDNKVNKLVLCLEYDEIGQDSVPVETSTCNESNREADGSIREHFKIRVLFAEDVVPDETKGISCPLTAEGRKNIHEYFCEKLKGECPECTENPCLILAEIFYPEPSSSTPLHESPVIDTCSRRKIVYSNPAIFNIINCTYQYLGTWLVLGPIFNPAHQAGPHNLVSEKADDHPWAHDIITDITENEDHLKQLDPGDITSSIDNAPSHGDIVYYGVGDGTKGSYFNGTEYRWRMRSFLGMNWMNIFDFEDNIHKHLPGDFSDDPFDPTNHLNFSGKHHALVFFLLYIKSPENRETKLCIRSDDAIRVWLNKEEITKLAHKEDRNITDYKEYCADITLREGTNILLAAVAETHLEWGFSARIEHPEGLRFMTDNPKNLFKASRP